MAGPVAVSPAGELSFTPQADAWGSADVTIELRDDAGNTVKPFFAAGTDDTITLNRTTTGSTRKGEYVELIDMATNLWHVQGVIAATGAEATPFSATV